MNYYFIDGVAYKSKKVLNKQVLTLEQYNFALLNPNVSLQEILDMELLPVPEPEEIPYVPSFEDRLALIEEYIMETAL